MFDSNAFSADAFSSDAFELEVVASPNSALGGLCARVYLKTGCSSNEIDPELYGDNDAKLAVTGLPTGLTVQWGIVPGSPVPNNTVSITAIHVDVSGTCTETASKPTWMTNAGLPDSPNGIYYTATVEGSAITQRLVPGYLNNKVALLVRAAQDFRVYGLTTVRDSRLANAANNA